MGKKFVHCVNTQTGEPVVIALDWLLSGNVLPHYIEPAETWKQAWKRLDSRSKKLLGSVRFI